MELINYIRSEQTDSIRSLLADQPDLANMPDERGFTPLVLATYIGKKDVAETLIDCGADIDKQDAIMGNTALMGVCFKGSLELAEMLIAKGANVNLTNKEGKTALNFAQEHGHDKIAELLSASVNETIETKSS